MRRTLTVLAITAGLVVLSLPVHAAPLATDGTDLSTANDLIPGAKIFGDSGWIEGSTLPIAEARPDGCKGDENDEVAVYRFDAKPSTTVRFTWKRTAGQQICRGQVYKRTIDGTALTTIFTYQDVPDRAGDFHFQSECRCFENDPNYRYCPYKFQTPSDASFEDAYYLVLWPNADAKIARDGSSFRLRAEVRRKSKILLDLIGVTESQNLSNAAPTDRVVLAATVTPRNATGIARLLVERKQGSAWVRYKRIERTLKKGRVSTARRYPVGTYRISANYLGDKVTASDRTGEWRPRSTDRTRVYQVLKVS